MERDTYGSAPVTAPGKDDMPAEGEGAASDTPSVDEENQMSDTSLVSTKMLSPEGEPVKEGDEIMVKVVSVHGDQAIIKCVPKEEGGEEGPPSADEGTDYENDFSAMSEKGM